MFSRDVREEARGSHDRAPAHPHLPHGRAHRQAHSASNTATDPRAHSSSSPLFSLPRHSPTHKPLPPRSARLISRPSPVQPPRTGLSAGHNSAVTIGLDLNLPKIRLIRPSVEVRVLAPYSRGSVDSEKDVLAGPRAELRLGRFHPYFDLLIGRGSKSLLDHIPFSAAASFSANRRPRSFLQVSEFA